MYNPGSGMSAYKRTLAKRNLIRKNSICSGGSGFPLSLSDTIKPKIKCVECVIK